MLVTNVLRFGHIGDTPTSHARRSIYEVNDSKEMMIETASMPNLAREAAVTASRLAGRRLAAHCAAYKGADSKRAIVQLIVTGAPFLILCALMLVTVDHAYWLTALFTLPAAGLLVRLFIIQHDCGHGSFLGSRSANDRLGRVISLFTMTPYGYWRRAHARHHATSGNLDRRGTGDVTTLTVKEYRASPFRKRLAYRLYRNPFVLLLVGGPVHFTILQRLPPRMSLSSRETWRSVFGLDAALVVFYGLLAALVGFEALLVAYLPMIVIASWIGGSMFYVQHQFENTSWTRDRDWEFEVAAINGSSYLALPRLLQWFTGSIGLHHVHHLNSMIPNYRLQECLDGSPELKSTSRLTIAESLKSARLALWDEERRKLVGFRDVRRGKRA